MVDVLSLPLWPISPKLFQDWLSRVIPRNEGTREVPPHNLFLPLCAAGALLKGGEAKLMGQDREGASERTLMAAFQDEQSAFIGNI